ncbi:MAG: hypothetical protein NVS3B10_23280 [Polyangiales bacterium]
MIKVSRSVIVASFAVAAFACNSLDSKKLESNISSTLTEKGVEMKSVSCPANVKSGEAFTCTGETKDGDKVTFDVTQKGGGDVAWVLRGQILDAQKLGDSIESKVGNKADVQCPKKTILLVKGSKVSCDVVIDGQKSKVDIVASDDQGNVDWKMGGGGGNKPKPAAGDDDDDKGTKHEADDK